MAATDRSASGRRSDTAIPDARHAASGPAHDGDGATPDGTFPAAIDHEALARAAAAVGADISVTYRVDAANVPVLAQAAGLAPARANDGTLRLLASVAAEAVQTRRAVVLEDAGACSMQQLAQLRATGLGCVAAIPLLALDRVQAVAVFACSGARRLHRDAMHALQSACDQASAALGRARLMAELHSRDEALRHEARRRQDFIATLAHELRNPLAPILNAVALLRSPVSDQQLAWCRSVIERQSAHLSVLLEDLLDMSRVTSNKIRLRRERVALGQVIDDAMETTRPLFEAQQHRVTVDLPERPVEIHVDPVRLAQVVGNLLNNAARYTDPGGDIAVVARANDHEVSIAVRDNGIGIEAERLPEVFDMFAQLAPALERSRGGLGIGLALAQGLAGLHGGRIEARSGGPGRGSEFIVHLPASAVQAGSEYPAPRARARRDERALHVLVIDDNRDAAETLAALLMSEGITVRTAFDGLQGLRLLEQWRPAAALIDIGMPRLDGYALCRLIRAQPWGESMTLIACTGWGQECDRQRSRDAGFDHHLVKPVELEEVLGCVRALA